MIRVAVGWLLRAGAAAWLAACLGPQDPDPQLQGPGSEVVGLLGSAKYADGRPAKKVLVVARPFDYLMEESPDENEERPGASGYTDHQGMYRLELQPGRYSLEVRDNHDAGLIQVSVNSGESVHLAPPAVLRQMGGMRGTVIRPRLPAANILVQIRGLDRRTFADTGTGSFWFHDLPPGEYSLRISSPTPASGFLDVDGILVESNKVSELGGLSIEAAPEDYSAWSNSRRIFIRTGLSGASLTKGVKDFPLAVKLNSDNFPFNTVVSPTGADIRFANAAGLPLPYEIESWDLVKREATIWVRVDTVLVNDNSQFIRLYWGNPTAPDLSLGREVFDTQRGFRHVWHFNEKDRSSIRFQDATGAENTLTEFVPLVVDTIGTPLFQGVHLDHGVLASSQRVRSPKAFTVSLWFSAATDGRLLSFENSHSGNGSTQRNHHLWIGPAGDVRFSFASNLSPSGWVTLTSPESGYLGAPNAAWHHVAITGSDAGETAVYLDGGLVVRDDSLAIASEFDGYWVLGGLAESCNCENAIMNAFQGSVDEVRIEEISHSPEWIRLSYENQKPQSRMVSVEP